MKNEVSVAVCSRTFSRNRVLRQELLLEFPNAHFNDDGLSLSGETLIEFLSGHERAIVALEVVNSTVLDQLPELKVISKYGVGLDMIDLEALKIRGVRLGWMGGVNRRSVAELVIGFAITMLRHIPSVNRDLLAGKWTQRVGGCLTGRTIGVIGCGHVGKDLVRLLQPFDCEILAHDIRDYSDFYSANQVEAVDLEILLKRSDVVTLHVPLDPSTRGILTGKRLALMKPGSILINTARGGLVDEDALKKFLQEDRIAAAAFDVFFIEPPEDPELLALPNFLSTPHIGGSSEEGILAMGRAAIMGLTNNEIPSSDFG